MGPTRASRDPLRQRCGRQTPRLRPFAPASRLRPRCAPPPSPSPRLSSPGATCSTRTPRSRRRRTTTRTRTRSSWPSTGSTTRRADLHNTLQWAFGEMRSDNTSFQFNARDRGGSDLEAIDEFTMSADNNLIASYWSTAYNGIAQTNYVLRSIDGVAFGDEARKERAEGGGPVYAGVAPLPARPALRRRPARARAADGPGRRRRPPARPGRRRSTTRGSSRTSSRRSRSSRGAHADRAAAGSPRGPPGRSSPTST